MLVCLSCNIEYKDDKKFCNYCGGRLVTKEDLPSSQKNTDKKEEEKTDQKLFCPNCKIIYEFGSSCIQCGSALVTQILPKEKEALETDVKKPGDEKESFQTEKPEEQQTEEPRQNLICPTCKIIYEHGNFCIKCGLTLVPRSLTQTEEEPKISPQPEVEEKPIPLQTFQEQLNEIPRQKLVCPHCRIIYEHGNACIRCGSTLVTEIPSQEKKEPELPKASEVSSSTPVPEVGTRLPDSAGVAWVKKEEPEAAPTLEVEEETPGAETPEQQDTKKPADHSERRSSHPGKRKVNYRRLFLEVGSISIMVLAGGYFVWSIYAHFIMKEPASRTPSKEISGPAPRGSSMASNPTATVSIPKESDKRETEQGSVLPKEKPELAPPPASTLTPSDVLVADTLEIGKVKDLLDSIKQANLQKNIDLFMSCYATDFKDREGKGKATVAFWKQFDYLVLSYDLKNSSISGDTAKAKVEWLIKISSTTGGQPQESKTIMDVTLKKEEGGWKIKEVKQVR